MIQLLPSESVLFALRALFEKHGYSQYKMSKFEEYDLYAKNKDFLISDSVITFTDGNGKLLALKPDVTLSIVKNTKDQTDTLQRLYYNENVYRIAKGQRNFKEIMQVGLECIGNIDDYCIYEVLKTALDSLEQISKTNVLSVSNLGVLSEVMDYIGVTQKNKADVLIPIGEKNLHELSALLTKLGIDDQKAYMLKNLIKLNGKTEDVLNFIQANYKDVLSEKTYSAFMNVMIALKNETNVNIDFSVVGDINYYNGFVFKGFVESIPQSVLSGGQYDMLMKKMNRKSGAIGFAVYLDTIEQFNIKKEEYDVDAVLVYDNSCSIETVANEVKKLNASGESVLAEKKAPENIKYKKLVNMKNGRVENVEENA